MNKEHKVPEWLTKAQDGSWEAEILISGILLFALFNIPDMVETLRFKIFREFGMSDFMRVGSLFMVAAVYWLIIGFVTHMVMRGLWIGLVGLSYVFPKGINREKIDYHQKFNNDIQKIPFITDSIIRLESFCSLIFSVSFLFFTNILGLSIFVAIVMGVPAAIGNLDSGVLSVIALVFSFFTGFAGLVYFIDYLGFGFIKRISWLAPVYYPVYRVLNVLTLSFLYRNIYYTLITNVKKKYIYSILIIYTFITFLLTINLSTVKIFTGSTLDFFTSNYQTFLNPTYYDNLKGEKHANKASIQSDIISDGVVRLFLVHYATFEEHIRDNCPEFTETANTHPLEALQCMNEFYQVYIDGNLLTGLQWVFHEHSGSNEKGIMTWIDVEGLADGQHVLEVKLKNYSATKYLIPEGSYAHIPFFKR